MNSLIALAVVLLACGSALASTKTTIRKLSIVDPEDSATTDSTTQTGNLSTEEMTTTSPLEAGELVSSTASPTEEPESRQLCRQICQNRCVTVGVTRCRRTCFRRCAYADETSNATTMNSTASQEVDSTTAIPTSMSNSTESSTPDETEESPVVESLLQFELPTPEVDGPSEPGSGDIRRSFILTFHTDTSDDTKNQAIFDEHISRDVPAGDS